jgi:CubicO group peptidase (beta-lactamase class C family)
MRRSRLLLLLTLAACRTPAAAPPTDEIDRIVDDTVARAHVPGAAVAIVRDGVVARRELRGVANLEHGAAVTPETAFQIASTTKIFTGTLVLQLVEDGAIRLDDPVSRWLPDAPEAWAPITIAHLAAHTSGIAEVDAPDDASLEEVYGLARAAPLAYAPGTRAAYGKTDLAVMALVLERATGTTFGDLLRARIFEPLGFTCTRYEDATEEVTPMGATRTAEVIADRATVYRWVDGRQRIAWFRYPRHAYASGGVFSCLADLERWAIALDEGRLLSPASEALATEAGPGGFGVVFSTTTLHGRAGYGHSGGPALADVVRIPDEKLTVIVLTNQQRLFPVVAPTIASASLGAPPATPAATDTDPERTARDRAVIDGVATGVLDDAAFTDEARAGLVPELRVWGPVIAAPWPVRRDLVLAAATPGAREYVATYGRSVRVRWTVATDEHGAIESIEPRVE